VHRHAHVPDALRNLRSCCLRWNPAAEELYSGSSDSNIVVWSPAREAVSAERDGWQGRDSDGDDWSD